jgi:proline dehydrogenase
MGISRNLLLWGSKNPWLLNHVPNYKFVKQAVKRFMPGENLNDAIIAAKDFSQKSIPTVFTHLGENITELKEADEVTNHYLDVLDKISKNNIETEVSLKLTQIGLDLSFDKSLENFKTITKKADSLKNFTWIDMEGSPYTSTTLDFYKRVKEDYQNSGICLQAYLLRTENDLKDLLKIKPSIRLVKGAYNEPKDIAFEKKSDVDDNYFRLAEILLNEIRDNNLKAAFATHDIDLINKIIDSAGKLNVPKDKLEFQMLYGIKTAEQLKLVKKGYKLKVLISYGAAWYPWYMRRLAERPANVGFVIKNIFQ